MEILMYGKFTNLEKLILAHPALFDVWKRSDDYFLDD
jgi:hypothetical protein